MADIEAFSISLTRAFAAPRERVFDAWLDPVSAAKWLFATPNGTMIKSEIDPVLGGEFCLTERREDEDIEHYGEFIEFERPSRIVFDFSVNQSETSRVAVDIVSVDSGAGEACELTLTHTMHPRWASFAERSKQGWEMMLDGLAGVVG